jgi:hypothetical protein
MNQRACVFLILALCSAAPALTHADEDGSYLDPKYENIQRPVRLSELSPELRRILEGLKDTQTLLPRRSPVLELIERQTPVRSQAARGTCSIFSAIALLESELVRRRDLERNLDLSEEWLQYIISHTKTTDGSSSYSNFSAISRLGAIEEQWMPYIGETWESAEYSELSKKRCGHLSDRLLKSCLISHRDPRLMSMTDAQLLDEKSGILYDPEFQKARSRSREFKDSVIGKIASGSLILSVEDAKRLLHKGTAITLDLDFYYGAWNHRGGEKLGITRNMDHWSRGIVGYPEPGSLDRLKSPTDPAGHSVLVVGYDDDFVVESRVQMEDGSIKEFRYRGVYFIKNSWGAGNFGIKTEIEGRSVPGYGIITQKYAEEFGGFYRLELE